MWGVYTEPLHLTVEEVQMSEVQMPSVQGVNMKGPGVCNPSVPGTHRASGSKVLSGPSPLLVIGHL